MNVTSKCKFFEEFNGMIGDIIKNYCTFVNQNGY
jgi:hypothetical protein